MFVKFNKYWNKPKFIIEKVLAKAVKGVVIISSPGLMFNALIPISRILNKFATPNNILY